jgi:hypothetical protein
MTKNNLGLLLICVLAIVIRLLPHAANVAPFTALALISGYYFRSKIGFLIPILASIVTDAYVGFYPILGWVYASYALIFFSAFVVKKSDKLSFKTAIPLALFSCVLFFLITNIGVWLTSSMYAPTPQGLVDCFIKALPFFRNSLIGDMYYTVVFIVLKTFVFPSFFLNQLTRGYFRIKLMHHPHFPAEFL